MKKVLLSLVLAVMSLAVFAQGGIKGTLTDDANLPLIGATVVAKDASGAVSGTVTDIDGTFMLTLKDGSYTVETTYTGYESMKESVTVAGSTVDMGSMVMSFSSVGLSQVNVIASLAIDRRTPVAVTTLKGDKIEALVGNQEYVEVLRSTPSVYVTKSGGGFGDSRINVRGFDQRNTAVMINGIPVNDMENGWVFWSNWAGLSDVTSSLQVQRGLGAAKTVVPSVGGSINIVTNAADFKKGGSASVSIGNDGFQKYGVMLSSGLSEKGFAATMQLTHTRGDGYVDGTAFQAYSYFLSLSQNIGDNHTIALTAVGAPQWHHQRTYSVNFDNLTLDTYVDGDGDMTNTSDRGIRFNPNWGMLNGEEFSWRRNFYHKPKAFINHYWTINEKTDLKTSAYVSLGRGGGTGPRGRLRTPGSVFDSFGGFDSGVHNADGQVRFDDIAKYNRGEAVDGWGDAKEQINGQYLVGNGGRIEGSNAGSGFIRRASMNSHNWFGVLSTLTTKLSDDLTLIGGIDGRYYKGIHYRRLENLLGADGYVAQSDDNNSYNLITKPSEADFGNFSDDSYKDGSNVLNYYNDGLVSWMGVFAQLEYNKDNLSAFLSLSGSNQGFRRVDYFNYAPDDTPSNDINDDGEYRESDWENFLGGTVKAGFNYNINENHNIFVNAGYLSRQPIFDNVFINFQNTVNEDAKNQDIYAIELGYGFRNKNFKANVNLYNTVWDNRQFNESYDAFDTDSMQVDILANFSGVKERHTGAEIELSWRPINSLTINGMASLGNWEYSDNFTGNVANLDTDQPLLDYPDNTIEVFADGIKVGDAAQTTFSLSANFEPIYGMNIYASYYYADNLYAEFNIGEEQFLKSGGEVLQLPSYSLVDAGISYRFDWDKIDATFRFNVNNLLDEIYVAELDTNILDEDRFHENKGFYGFGRTWNAGVKIKF